MRPLEQLTYTLFDCDELRPFWALLDAGEDASCGIAQSARPLLVAARFARFPQPTLVVAPGEEAAELFARNLITFLGRDRVMRYPARCDYPWDDQTVSASLVAQRLQALYALHAGRDVIVVASMRSLLQKGVPASLEPWDPLVCQRGASILYHGQAVESYEDVRRALEAMGYANTGELEGPGTFASQGGAIDVFPGNMDFPLRLDFFGDEIEDIRRIVPTTGQTIASLEEALLFPVCEMKASRRAFARAREKLHNPAKTNPVLRELLEKTQAGLLESHSKALLPYLYDKPEGPSETLGSEVLTVLLEPRSLIDDALHAYDAIGQASAGSGLSVEQFYMAPADLSFGKSQRATYESIMRVGTLLDAEMPVKRTEVAGEPEKLFGRLRNLCEGGYVCALCVPHGMARDDIKLELVDRAIPIVDRTADAAHAEGVFKPGVVNVCDFDIPLGFILPKAKLALVSLADTQGSKALKASRQIDLTEVTFPFSPGDYVVHAAHGVAFFRAIVRQELAGAMRDYLLLEYAQDDKLYVPVEQLDRVTRYVGPEGSAPRLTRLNTSDWSRAMTRAHKASRKLAFDLIDVYTRRAATQGFAFSADTPWQRQMEEDFPYEETRDQLQAISDVKADMQAPRPMDRLICGDVGFGKTEVALRAAFKATQDAKQVMVLCPTTILAQQHYTTFSDRFAPYGIHVEVLSRFRTLAQQRLALDGFADGSVEVLVGTHRLLSRDVNPKDLGLVIIDEEQRFGVGHKEQLKSLRESIDVLTLSATPIPRTMQMGLSGVRDMSLILTPPDDRRPVEVHVGEWDPDIVSGAIGRELDRGGQVYYVSNRVRSMKDATERVGQVAPQARVGIAHGQMSKDELESVMEEFSAGTIDVLVATTIIESGIDNPHTNTLIIEDAQRLGLAQMYQLKGRVGRSSRQAYAYFMFPEQVYLSEEAMARLSAINEHQNLGSGMRIAMRDLEIRGAGTLLGAEQSGNMSAVGFDLFAQMLNTAVAETREGKTEPERLLPPALSDITVNVPAHTYIPDEYVPDADARVLLYRKLAYASTVSELQQLQSETVAHFGPMPQATTNYFLKCEIKALASDLGISLISVVASKLMIEPLAQPREGLMRELRGVKARYVSQSKKLHVPLRYFALEEDGSLLEAIRDFLILLENDNR